jgi:hypothetical protein
MSVENCTFRVNFYPMQFRNIAGFRDGPLLRYRPLYRDFGGMLAPSGREDQPAQLRFAPLFRLRRALRKPFPFFEYGGVVS